MLSRVGRHIRRWASRGNPYTNVYGLARTILAVSTAATLALSHTETLFRPTVVSSSVPVCEGIAGDLSLFCQLPPSYLSSIRWIAVALLVVVASGWRPRLTCIFHWWISFSLMSSSVLMDGGDQVAAILTLLMLPVCLTDQRVWHWQPPIKNEASQEAGRLPNGELRRRLVALSSFALIRLQVAAIYFHAAIGKMQVTEWADGTAVYYWLSDPVFGLPSHFAPIVRPLLVNGTTLTAITWGTIILEMLLAAGLVMDRRGWKPLLIAGLAFHAGIGLFQGLVSFAIIMMAALILYLHPVREQLGFLAVDSHLGKKFAEEGSVFAGLKRRISALN